MKNIVASIQDREVDGPDAGRGLDDDPPAGRAGYGEGGVDLEMLMKQVRFIQRVIDSGNATC